MKRKSHIEYVLAHILNYCKGEEKTEKINRF